MNLKEQRILFRMPRPLSLCFVWAFSAATGRSESIARVWNEECLDGIRRDFPAPTIHARNLFHTSAAMYDAWAAFDSVSVGVFHNETATNVDLAAARNEAVSYAGYHVLKSRYAHGVNAATTLAALDARMDTLGYDKTYVITPGTINSPAAVGIRSANAALGRADTDQSNESNLYVDTTGYASVNDTLNIFGTPPGTVKYNFTGGITATETVNDINRWQRLAFENATTQNGQVASNVQIFISPHWGYVRPFALTGEVTNGLYADIDPGDPPYLGGVGDAQMKSNVREVIEFSSKLDAASGVTLDISPMSRGNNTLGQNDGTGHAVNPVTTNPYAPNVVKEGDFARVISEFWADGPNSETPPGHWNTVANDAFDHPSFERRLGGAGPILAELEWDVKFYLALNAALHDTAVAAWGVKAHYDYVRPITLVRYMGEKGQFNITLRGQSSDSNLPSYHPNGLPLVPGLIELVTSASRATGQRHQGLTLNDVVIRAWDFRNVDRSNGISPGEVGGVSWMTAGLWRPYQLNTFVTPAFAGYVSGHSAFSRAAAEVLVTFTGSEFFPGGLGSYTFLQNSLEFEEGPTEDITLQWATYYDAADQAGISRLYGGIHVAADDGPGRIMGSKIGKLAASRALQYIDGSILDNFRVISSNHGANYTLTWPTIPGYSYKVQSAPTPDNTAFTTDETGFTTTVEDSLQFIETTSHDTRYYRILRQSP